MQAEVNVSCLIGTLYVTFISTRRKDAIFVPVCKRWPEVLCLTDLIATLLIFLSHGVSFYTFYSNS